MPIANRLEARLGHLAIPGLVQVLAGLQLVTFFLLYFMPDEGASAFLRNLILIREEVFSGQVWRLVTHMFIPRAMHPLFALIGALFLMFIGRGLDDAWGPFRVNLFVIGGYLSITLGSLLFGFTFGAVWIWPTLLFAFAMFYPNQEIMLMFVIPVKIKWVAWITAGIMAFTLIGQPTERLPILCAILPFALAFGPGFVHGLRHAATVRERRQRFETAQRSPEEAFHQCASCGKTEQDDRHLEWRVTDDGEEYCSACRPLKASTEG